MRTEILKLLHLYPKIPNVHFEMVLFRTNQEEDSVLENTYFCPQKFHTDDNCNSYIIKENPTT